MAVEAFVNRVAAISVVLWLAFLAVVEPWLFAFIVVLLLLPFVEKIILRLAAVWRANGQHRRTTAH